MIKFTELTNRELDYIQEVCDSHGLATWDEVASKLNNELNMNYSSSWYRKKYANKGFVTSMVDNEPDLFTADELQEEYESKKSELNDILREVKKTRVAIADERSQNSIYLRRLSREETLKEIAADFATKMSSGCPLDIVKRIPEPVSINDDLHEGVLLLSDWHYGMVCDNPWNYYDPQECKNRVAILLYKVIDICKKHDVKKVTVLNLSDLIAGRIHTQIRIESRFDVITQTMEVSEILAQFLTELSKYVFVDYYDCLDNHSRLDPNKKESMDLESLTRIIPWYLKQRLADNNAVTIKENEFGADIITCTVLGHNVIGVHGDNDKPTTALERLSLMTHKHYDMLCTAHLHHFSADEEHQSVVVSNSSLMGVDSYSAKLRLSSKPSQTFVVASTENVCECIYKINFD